VQSKDSLPHDVGEKKHLIYFFCGWDAAGFVLNGNGDFRFK
jgi:hypothetical protein